MVGLPYTVCDQSYPWGVVLETFPTQSTFLVNFRPSRKLTIGHTWTISPICSITWFYSAGMWAIFGLFLLSALSLAWAVLWATLNKNMESLAQSSRTTESASVALPFMSTSSCQRTWSYDSYFYIMIYTMKIKPEKHSCKLFHFMPPYAVWIVGWVRKEGPVISLTLIWTHRWRRWNAWSMYSDGTQDLKPWLFGSECGKCVRKLWTDVWIWFWSW